MKIYFSKLIIHNFLSYGHVEINLNDKGYCLVSGINKNPIDNALSNGAGKSSWGSALCWALTGETVQGISTNLKNRNVEENSCYVSISFSADKSEYVVTRFKEPKSDLHISINGQDKSGKGIRESEAILAQYLPDLTGELIGSIIILGQGLPCKFSNNSPSGRKEVLEKLSKSDFMIQDIKNRLIKVVESNNANLRVVDDNILTLATKVNLYNSQLTDSNNILTELEKPHNFDSDIAQVKNDISAKEELVKAHNLLLIAADSKIKELNEELNKLNSSQNKDLQDLNNQFNEVKTSYIKDKNTLDLEYTKNHNSIVNEFNEFKNNLSITYTSQISDLKAQILMLENDTENIKNIKDVCPTCHQRIPNVIKPDTTQKQLALTVNKDKVKTLETEFNTKVDEFKTQQNLKLIQIKEAYDKNIQDLNNSYKAKEVNYNSYVKQINENYEEDLLKVKTELKKKHDTFDLYNLDIKQKQEELLTLNNNLNKLNLDKDNYLIKLKEVKDKIDSLKQLTTENNSQIDINSKQRDAIKEKLNIDNKLNTLIKRDFRGFLLSNVISFIDKKCKEYALDIFHNSNLDFTLDGNNINIAFAGKSFENLSGGEKQKIDLIVQFAIRDMMSRYLDFSSNILILDEIFDQLDVIGCNNLINLISDKLIDLESIYIISHRADELEIPYDHELIVTKSEKDISSIQEL